MKKTYLKKDFNFKDFSESIEHIEDKEGVYMVYTRKSIIIRDSFKNIKLRKESQSYPSDFLIKRFNLYRNEHNQILYIGSSSILKTRIKDLYETMIGESLAHTGGRALSQIDNFDQLNISYGYYKNAKAQETKLIKKFAKEHGFLPFANMRF